MRTPDEMARHVATRWFEEGWNQRRLGTVRELWAEGGVGHVEGMPDISLDDFVGYREQMLRGVPDFHVEVLDMVTKGEKVVVQWKITGTHEGPLFGVPPTGRSIEELGMTKFLVRDGQVVEGWDSWNLGALLDRLARPSIEDVAREQPLTRRQAEVALLMAERLSAKEIAKQLGIRLNTARRHCQAVLRRLGLHSRTDVAEALGRADVPVHGPHSPSAATE